MKYDPYVNRYITLEDYIKECYGGLPSESLLEEECNKLPDHPGEKSDHPDPSSITMTFIELYGAFRDVEMHTKQAILNSVADIQVKWKDRRVSEDDLMLIFEEILKL